MAKRNPYAYVSYLGWVSLLAVVAGLYAALAYAPTEAEMGDVQRIFYFHVASAWNGLFAFTVVFVASLLYLRTGKSRWDLVAESSAEIGVVFTTLVLLTGPIWARPVWGVWWTMDPRLTTTLVLWFIYVAYLAVRQVAGGGEREARLAAVFGVIGFVDVPIVWFAIRWWRSIHPVLITMSGMNMAPRMVLALVVSVVAFTLLYFYLLAQRVRLGRLAAEVSALKDGLRG